MGRELQSGGNLGDKQRWGWGSASGAGPGGWRAWGRPDFYFQILHKGKRPSPARQSCRELSLPRPRSWLRVALVTAERGYSRADTHPPCGRQLPCWGPQPACLLPSTRGEEGVAESDLQTRSARGLGGGREEGGAAEDAVDTPSHKSGPAASLVLSQGA